MEKQLGHLPFSLPTLSQTLVFNNWGLDSYYDRGLPKLGYSPFAVGTGDNGSLMLMYMKAEKLLVISVIPVKGFTLVMITAP